MVKPLLVIPTYDGKYHYEVMERILNAAQTIPELAATQQSSSFLTHQFNRYFCHALNDKSYTHFVMLHSDIVPAEPQWCQRLIELADKHGVDVLSAVAPIKNPKGLTSTALAYKGEFGNFRRVTMRELKQLPEIIFRDDLANLFGWTAKRTHLLVNTGVMCVRLEKRRILENMHFTTGNWIRRTNEGKFYAVSEPEDWNWSAQAQERGLVVAATKAIRLKHLGEFGYRNDVEWGLVEHDAGDPKE